MRFRGLVAAFVTSTVFASIAASQTSKGILVGVARDSSGAVIPNANVTITGDADKAIRSISTKPDGSYRFEALDPESYTVTVQQAGFQGFSAKKVIVQPSLVTTYDIKLSVGSANDTVNITADSQAINTENGQLTGIINTTDITKLPIFSLSPYELTTTVPGVQIVDQSGFSNGINIQVNGARPRANNFLLDGQEINDVSIGGQAFQPSIPDMYESVAVLTNSASAEFGRAGGGVVNLVTKSGTNQFHGEAYERYTGSGLNALGGQERGTGAVKARFDNHVYGFTAGGPVIKDKLFAFGGLELSRFYGSETPSVLELPDANGYAQLQKIGGPQVALLDSYLSNGNYLASYVNVQGRTLVNTNVGPQNGCPTTGCIITENFFQRPSQATSNPDTQWTYRIDYKPWDKDSFSFRYLHDRSSLSPDFGNNGSALVGFDTLQGGPGELGEGTWTHIFTPNFLNEFRVSETRINFQFGPTAETSANPLFALQSISIPGIINAAGTSDLGPNQNFPQGRGEDLYQLQDTVGITKGIQSFRIGFDIGRQLEKDLVSQNAKGTLSFVKGGTNAAGVSYVTALGNFLQNQLGPSGTATKTFGNTRVDPHGWRSGVFAQDDIKLTSDLTVNLGVRFDYLTNPENSLQFPGLDPANPLGIITLVSGAPTAQVFKIKNDTNNISPRFGFAYSPHNGSFIGDGKSVIRGGFGIFYDSDFSNFVINAAQSSPNAVAGTLVQTTGAGLANATSLVPTIAPQLKLNSSVTSVVNNMVNPVTYQYNLGIERQLPGNLFLAVRYVGTSAHKLFANQQYNYFSGATGARLNPAYGAVVARGNFADSNYNSLEVEGSHLFSHGFQIRGTYTYSKTLDDGSEIFTTFSSPTSYTANLAPGGRGQDYGNSAYDHRHYAVISYVWSPAGLHAENAITNAALGALTRHWTLSGIERFQSGPYSTFAVNGLDINGDGSTANDRPINGNLAAPAQSAGIDGHFIGGTNGVYYDLAANNSTGALTPVSTSAVRWLVPYGPGNQYLRQEIGRNSYSNPGLQFHDLALEKGIGLSYLHLERGQLILRGEVQNIGNHNNIGPLDTNVLDIGTGNYFNRLNAQEDAGRTMVLWAKVAF
ncbi:TonB-dependent receptor [Granulicella arctica]|uniref:TonB-dependent receptor n=1 Tax=Granulicella arctica TaxID=940613 RepID=UPI0021E0A288|nr:carboxypeptidase regulatory-like domain-containing protein [Granulicella arctica]